MSKLYLASSFVRDSLKNNYSLQNVSQGTLLYAYFKCEYGNGEFYETIDGNLIVPKTNHKEEKRAFLKNVLKELKTKIVCYRTSYGSLDDRAYYKSEYPKGSFYETIDGDLLIPNVLETKARVKEKVL